MPKLRIDIHPIIHQLLSRLKEEGFSIGNDIYIETTKLFNWFIENKKGQTIESFCQYLSPLICKCEEEQLKFKKIFETEFANPLGKIISNQIGGEGENKKIWTTYLAWGGIVGIIILSIFILIALIYQPLDITHELVEHDYFVHKNEERGFNIAQMFNHYPDTSDFDFQTTFHQAGLTKKGAYVRHIFNKYGKDTIGLKIFSSKYPKLNRAISYPEIYVGPDREIKIIPEKEYVYAGEENTYMADIDTAFSNDIYWEVNGDTIVQEKIINKTILTYRFDTAGDYIIRISYNKRGDDFISHFPDKFILSTYTENVIEPGLQLTVNHKPSSPIINFSASIPWLVALLCSLLGLVYTLIRVCKKEKLQPVGSIHDDKFSGSKPPYHLPFTSRDQIISGNYILTRLSNELKKRTETESSLLNIPKTIQQSIRNLGFMSPEYSKRLAQREYLFLIDQAYFNSQQARLFAYLSIFLISRSVRLEFYFFNRTPDRFYKFPEGPRIPLSTIQDQHYQSALIIISEGNFFIDTIRSPENKGPASDREKISNKFSYWDHRILLTPVPYDDWGRDEINLATFFQLLPADVSGLLELIKVIEDGSYPLKLNLDSPLSTYLAKYVDFHTSQTLRKYLDDDEELFQWLCSMAIHPKFYWEVLLETGKSMLNNKSKINYSTLLKLTRIKWIHEGAIPPGVRLMMLKELTVDNELLARETLLRMMSEIPIGDDIFSFEEKELSRFTNSFILFASGKKKYTGDKLIKEGEEKFLHLYKNKMLGDNPFIQYVEKKQTDAGKWETPIRVKSLSTDINHYIEAREQGSKADNRNKNLIRYTKIGATLIGIVSVLILLNFILLAKKVLANNPINDALGLIDTTRLQDNSIKIKFAQDGCLNSLLSTTENPSLDLEAIIENNSKRFFNFFRDDTLLLEELINSNNINIQSIQIQLNVNKQSFTSSIPYVPGLYEIKIAGSCPGSSLIVNYYPGSKEDTARVSSVLRKNNYVVNTFTEDQMATREANVIRFDVRIDTNEMHSFASLLLSIGFPLKVIDISNSEYEPFSGNKITAELSADKAYDSWPIISRDSIDCLFLGKNCKIPSLVAKGTVQLFTNKPVLRGQMNRLISCIKDKTKFDILITESAPSLDVVNDNYIYYLRNTFLDSTKILISCLKAYFPEKNFKVRKMPPEWQSNRSAEIYIYDEKVSVNQPRVDVDLSSLKIYEDGNSLSMELNNLGYKMGGDPRISNLFETSTIEYYDSKVENDANKIMSVFRKLFPDNPIQIKYNRIDRRGYDCDILVWIKEPSVLGLEPRIYIRNPVLSDAKDSRFLINPASTPDSFLNSVIVTFDVILENIVEQNWGKPIEGELCIVNLPKSCNGISIPRKNGTNKMEEKLMFQINKPGRYEIGLKIKEFDIDTILGYLSFTVPTNPPENPKEACDTLHYYFGINSTGIKYGRNTYSKDALLEQNITIDLVELNPKYGIIDITKDKCRAQKITIYFDETTTINFCDDSKMNLKLLTWDNKLIEKTNEGIYNIEKIKKKYNSNNIEGIFDAIFCTSERHTMKK